MDVKRYDQTDADEWNSYVDRAAHATPFHRYEALSLLAREVGGEVYTLAGFVGNEPVGLLPVVVTRRGPLTFVRSPPELEVFTLGPVMLNVSKLKQRKRERRSRAFVDGCLDRIERDLDPDYVDIRTVDRYDDLRPFTWRGFQVSPAYTYVVSLDRDRDELLGSFSRDARSNVREGEAGDLTIERGGRETLERVVAQIRRRHDEQGKDYPLTERFVTDLYETLPEGTVRPYAARIDGELVGGIVTLESADTTYRWQGGATPDVDSHAINDCLDWHVMCDAADRGRTRYDLVGANLPRLCSYKAKFNPEPVAYYVAKRETRAMRTTKRLYHLASQLAGT